MSQSKSIKAARFKGDFGYKWYKVTTPTGFPIFGSGNYELPGGGKPGRWMTHVGHLVMCSKGYHVTQLPNKWWDYCGKRRLFEVEVSGPARPFETGHYRKQTSAKSLFRSMRLIREIKGAEKGKLLRRRAK